jgi:hypothetical protein
MTSEIRTESMENEAFAGESVAKPESVQTVGAPTYAGLDAGSYPDQKAMDAYRGMGFAVTGLYLTHAPARIARNKVDEGWIGAADYLAKTGWGIAPIYVGAEPAGSSTVPPPTDPLNDAQVDAAEAIALAQRAGLQTGRRIFLDVEAAFPVNTPYESYVLKWLEVVQAAGYRTALYCFPKQIGWCAAQAIPIWTVHLNKNTGTQDPKTKVITWSYLTSPLAADPIDAGAMGTQGRFYCQAAGLKIEPDYDRWTAADPSQP